MAMVFEKHTAYTGNSFNLLGKTSHSSGGTNVTGSQSGTGTLTFNQKVILTCA